MRALLVATLALALAGCVQPAHHAPAPEDPPLEPPATPATSGYAGEEQREIKALSPEEIAGYRKGAGLGYAKPAELNSYPGPLHALEMADALGLSEEQKTAIETIRVAMLDKVVPLGERYLVVEGAIEQGFRDDSLDRDSLAALLDESAAVESKIRLAHLEAHLATKALLTRHQIALYDEARGYGKADHKAHAHE